MSGAATTGTRSKHCFRFSRLVPDPQTKIRALSSVCRSHSAPVSPTGSEPKSIIDFLISLSVEANGPSCLLAQHEGACFHGDRLYVGDSVELIIYCHYCENMTECCPGADVIKEE